MTTINLYDYAMTIQLTKKHAIIAGIILVILIVTAPSVYFYRQWKNTKDLLKNPAEAVKVENKELIVTIAKIVDVPVGEEPTIATVSDKEKLKDQAFFARAENGDRVLFYASVKKAILYRPSTGKIIDMSPVNVGGSTPSAQVAGAETQAESSAPTVTIAAPVRIAIFNGTTTPKLANNMEGFIKEHVANIEVVRKDNAVKTDYTKTIVANLNESTSAVSSEIAQVIGGVGQNIPADEPKPDADILIIIGSDYKPQ